MILDYREIRRRAQDYETAMTAFLRDLIAIPGESGKEKQVIARIVREMRALEFDRVDVDPMGNVLGRMGAGEKLIAYDAHIDTVGTGDRRALTHMKAMKPIRR